VRARTFVDRRAAQNAKLIDHRHHPNSQSMQRGPGITKLGALLQEAGGWSISNGSDFEQLPLAG
jgi:hypothetical protein